MLGCEVAMLDQVRLILIKFGVLNQISMLIQAQNYRGSVDPVEQPGRRPCLAVFSFTQQLTLQVHQEESLPNRYSAL